MPRQRKSPNLDPHPEFYPRSERLDLPVVQRDAAAGPVDAGAMNNGIARADAVNADLPTQRCVLRRGAAGNPGGANPLVGQGIDPAFPQGLFGIVRIGVIQTDKGFKPAVVVDPADPEYAQWGLVVATFKFQSGAAAAYRNAIRFRILLMALKSVF